MSGLAGASGAHPWGSVPKTAPSAYDPSRSATPSSEPHHLSWGFFPLQHVPTAEAWSDTLHGPRDGPLRLCRFLGFDAFLLCRPAGSSSRPSRALMEFPPSSFPGHFLPNGGPSTSSHAVGPPRSLDPSRSQPTLVRPHKVCPPVSALGVTLDPRITPSAPRRRKASHVRVAREAIRRTRRNTRQQLCSREKIAASLTAGDHARIDSRAPMIGVPSDERSPRSDTARSFSRRGFDPRATAADPSARGVEFSFGRDHAGAEAADRRSTWALVRRERA